jgi:hypothetical protein
LTTAGPYFTAIAEKSGNETVLATAVAGLVATAARSVLKAPMCQYDEYKPAEYPIAADPMFIGSLSIDNSPAQLTIRVRATVEHDLLGTAVCACCRLATFPVASTVSR